MRNSCGFLLMRLSKFIRNKHYSSLNYISMQSIVLAKITPYMLYRLKKIIMMLENRFFFLHCRFRRGFKQFFRWCPFVHLTPEVLQRREVVTSRYSCSGSPDHNRIVRNGKCARALVYSKSHSVFYYRNRMSNKKNTYKYKKKKTIKLYSNIVITNRTHTTKIHNSTQYLL